MSSDFFATIPFSSPVPNARPQCGLLSIFRLGCKPVLLYNWANHAICPMRLTQRASPGRRRRAHALASPGQWPDGEPEVRQSEEQC